MAKALDAKTIAALIKPKRIIGTPDITVVGAAPLDAAKPDQLSFCNKHGQIAFKAINNSNAGIIICFDDVKNIEKFKVNKCFLTVANPRLAFIKCLNKFFIKQIDWGIHPTAIVEADVSLPDKIKIGPYGYVGHNVELGPGTVIEKSVHIAPKCSIGKNVHIQSGAVIGCTGQGFERNQRGELVKFPQIGNVIIEDDVEIGANSTIVRGTFYETKIGKGTKIGHLTSIGHNVQVGSHVFISSSVIVGGSTIIGDHSWLAPGAVVRDAVTIGKNVRIGLGAIITKDVKDNQTLIGIPACRRDDYVRTLIWTKHNIIRNS